MLAAVVAIGVFLAVTLAVFAWGSARPQAIGARLEPYGYGPAMPEEAELARPFTERAISPIIGALGRRAASLAPAQVLQGLSQKLAMAGLVHRLRPGRFLLLSGLCTVLFPGAFIAIVLATGSSFGILQVFVLLLLLVCGNRLPTVWLSLRVDARRDKITRSLPDALDLITVCVEAGLGLDAALAKVSQVSTGPLADEIRRSVDEISLGKPRRDALRDMAERAGVSNLRAFIAAVLQAQESGVSISQTLRVQSDALRIKRRQRAEELAAQAPLKMVFPLVFCILPATFVVILGPAAIRIWHALTD